jgi:hypothetical protein
MVGYSTCIANAVPLDLRCIRDQKIIEQVKEQHFTTDLARFFGREAAAGLKLDEEHILYGIDACAHVASISAFFTDKEDHIWLQADWMPTFLKGVKFDVIRCAKAIQDSDEFNKTFKVTRGCSYSLLSPDYRVDINKFIPQGKVIKIDDEDILLNIVDEESYKEGCEEEDIC